MSRHAKIAVLLGGTGFVALVVLLGWVFSAEKAVTWWQRLSEDPEQVRTFLRGRGALGAPLVFVGLQILQVVLAPFPGELSGFVGGYVFGTIPGFLYSSVGLTIGSMVNFLLARVLGRRYVRRWIRASYLSRFDTMAKRQGALVFFLFFVVPGFPKDYLCLFLGLTNLPAKVFVLMAAIGRMPGTLMLSLQGAQVFQKDYATLMLLIGLSLAVALPAYYWRERIYAWIESANRGGNGKG